MFPLNIAKSAEAILSRWAIRRVCKFLLKKKLGKFILGDVDLEQLDVQLREGIVQLTELALNVDYLNQQLGATPLIVKEGSIGSILVRIPWKFSNCQIEVDELELVLAPCTGSNPDVGIDKHISGQDGKQSVCGGLEKIGSAKVHGDAGSVSLDVHEGVKTIAKMVKWFLSSFNIKIRNLIVAFDPCLGNVDKQLGSHQILVLHITYTEFGTCVSEDSSPVSNSIGDGFLGMARLTNFINFQGAAIELLQIDRVGDQSQVPTTSGTTFIDVCTGSLPSGAATPMLTGESSGFSGTMKLSIPWKNGSLDIRKVDADLIIDPVKIRLQPTTIDWVICSWNCIRNAGVDGRSNVNHHHLDSSSHASCYQSFTSDCATTMDSATFGCENLSSGEFCFLNSQETATDASMLGPRVISNWVPLFTGNTQEDEAEAVANYSASVNQFFECFDGMRSSQAYLGNTGIWNWTVFSAITAASSLASGSMHISPEQQHVETNLRATVAGVSIVLLLDDENQDCQHDFKNGHGNAGKLNVVRMNGSSTISGFTRPTVSSMNLEGSNLTAADHIDQTGHSLEANCRDLVFTLQICPQMLKFEAIIKQISIDNYFNGGSNVPDSSISNCECEPVPLVQQLQAEVQSALPPILSSAHGTDSEETENCNFSVDDSLHMRSVNGELQGSVNRTIGKGKIFQVNLLKSVGVRGCQFAVSQTYSNDKSRLSTSLSIMVPPFILWVDFTLLNSLVHFWNKFGNSSEGRNGENLNPKVSAEQRDLSCCGDAERGNHILATPLEGPLQGDISVSQGRLILCFPSDNHGDFRHSYWDEFIVLDFSPLDMKNDALTPGIPNRNSQDAFSGPHSSSLHLSFGDINVYLITSACNVSTGDDLYSPAQPIFSAKKILSASRDHDSIINMIWQGGPATGPWIARRAWGLANSRNSRRNINEMMGKGYEFASATTAEDTEQANSCVLQEMILSSAFLLHIRLSCVFVNLGYSEYVLLHHLLNQLRDGFTCAMEANPYDGLQKEQDSLSDDSSSQVSVLLECAAFDLSINMDKGIDCRRSVQKELAGSWDSLRLTIHKFELLSVSNVGSINDANFFRLSHDEGELWGNFHEIDEEASLIQNLLLISCKNSTLRRGSGEGTNALACGSAGTSVLHLWDPKSFKSFTSMTVKCGTIIAPGGRLDWVNEICRIFSLPSTSEPGVGNTSTHNSEDYKARDASFLLEFVDVALSYEPHIRKSMVNGGVIESECRSNDKPIDKSVLQHATCLLAAASLNLSNENSAVNDYRIQLQDVGLLLGSLSGSANAIGDYDVDCLRKRGYVKVAGEALVKAVLRTNCSYGPLWEVECTESHINIETCHDTTAGLIRLIGQIQQLFAPDIEESLVHLESEQNTDQQAHGMDNTSQAGSHACCRIDLGNRSLDAGIMEAVLEDASYLNGNATLLSNSHKMESHTSCDGHLPDDAFALNITIPMANDTFSQDLSFNSSVAESGLENMDTSVPEQEALFTDFIESYYISDSLPVQKISADYDALNERDIKCKSEHTAQTDVDSGECGWYEDDSLRLIENHVSRASTQASGRQTHENGELPSENIMMPSSLRKLRGRILLKNIDVRWKMYAGSDWFNFITSFHVTQNTGGRDVTECLELLLSGMSIQYDMFPDGDTHVSKLSLSVDDFHLYDNSNDAPWKMVLGYFQSKDHPRESHAKAFKLDLEAVRPDPLTPLEEYRLRLAFLPMRLNLEQGQLDFLIKFFAKDSSFNQSPSLSDDVDGTTTSPANTGQTMMEEAVLPFFQKFDIWPVIVQVNYIPRFINLAALQGGNYAELLNLVPWKGIELQLKHVHAVGVYGWGGVCETIIGEWLEDISHNQVQKLLKGLAPIRSLFAVGSGAAKLVSLPIKSYRKDRRVLKGMQRGAIAFVRSISLEAIGLGIHLAAGAHDILLQTEYILSAMPPSASSSRRSRSKMCVRSNQPKDAKQGIQQAYESLSNGLGKTASALVGNPMKTYQRGLGAGSALATAVWAVPAAAIAPASATARAIHCTLLGVRNSLDPEHKKESMEKYLGLTQQQDSRK